MKTHFFKSKCIKSLLACAVSLGFVISMNDGSKLVSADNTLLYKLDFSNQENIGHNAAENSFSDAIIPSDSTITIEAGPKGKNAANLPGHTRDKNYFSLPVSIFENQNAITISSWYYLPSGVDAYLGEIGIYSPENTMSFRSDPYAYHFGGGYIYAVGNPDNGAVNLNTGVRAVYDAWYHMTYVLNGLNHQFKVYQNGEQVLISDIDESFKPSLFNTSSAHFYLGQSSYRSYHGEDAKDDYQGKISDFRVYSGALSLEDIKSEYALELTDFKTAEYTFDNPDNRLQDNVRGYNLNSYKADPRYEDGYLKLSGGSAVQAYNNSIDLNNNFFSGHSSLTITMDINIEHSHD